jgi:2,3-bisphosphoglycerate-independent phosphoglycerate mutase
VPVKIHAFTDGRDVSPSSARKYFSQLSDALRDCKNVKLATVSGRYYAMDRNENWDRVSKFYDVAVSGKSDNKFDSVDALCEKFYAENITDEFFVPSVASDYDGMHDDDAVLIANFRADRVRQFAAALTDNSFDGFTRDRVVKFSACVGIAEYSEYLNQFYSVMFAPPVVKNSLGEVVSKNGLKQLRIAETEKYAHVTFFFNGGEEKQFDGEDRILIPSPDVATFDLKPEMSAGEITEKLLPEIFAKKYDLIVLNFANPDMVGHTGKIPQTVQALEFLDSCVGQIRDAILNVGGTIVLTADHGNAEKMIDDDGVNSFTAHTTNAVPLCIISSRDDLQCGKISLSDDGKLADIAPTILHILGIDIPNEMSGKSLIVNNKK